ncbi:ankyrin repeat-containing domain protein [Pyronema domesticum]|nr:ankyrin repeat-containing domain protein [Pyronema domesticum]
MAIFCRELPFEIILCIAEHTDICSTSKLRSTCSYLYEVVTPMLYLKAVENWGFVDHFTGGKPQDDTNMFMEALKKDHATLLKYLITMDDTFPRAAQVDFGGGTKYRGFPDMSLTSSFLRRRIFGLTLRYSVSNEALKPAHFDTPTLSYELYNNWQHDMAVRRQEIFNGLLRCLVRSVGLSKSCEMLELAVQHKSPIGSAILKILVGRKDLKVSTKLIRCAILCEKPSTVLWLSRKAADIDENFPCRMELLKTAVETAVRRSYDSFTYVFHPIIGYLLEQGKYIWWTDDILTPALRLDDKEHRLRLVEDLLLHGAPVNEPTNYIWTNHPRTPLHEAVTLENPDVEIVRLMLERDDEAERLHNAKGNLTPRIAAVDAKNFSGQTPLHAAIAPMGGRDPQYLYVADPDLQLPLIKALLEHGASPTAIDNNGFTPLHEAIRRRGCSDIVKLLFKYTENKEELANMKTPNGNTPLHFAILQVIKDSFENQISMAKKLAEEGKTVEKYQIDLSEAWESMIKADTELIPSENTDWDRDIPDAYKNLVELKKWNARQHKNNNGDTPSGLMSAMQNFLKQNELDLCDENVANGLNRFALARPIMPMKRARIRKDVEDEGVETVDAPVPCLKKRRTMSPQELEARREALRRLREAGAAAGELEWEPRGAEELLRARQLRRDVMDDGER